MREQTSNEQHLETNNLNAAELIRAKVEELKILDQRVLQSEELLQRLNEAKASVDEGVEIGALEHRVEAYLELMRRGGKPDLADVLSNLEA